MVKFLKSIILIVATCALLSIFYDYGKGWYKIYQDEYKGTESTIGEDVVVEIPEGAAAKTIAKIL
ncbi:MAG: endolytic transglycosylase MltG, partial [Lachnospiraceae bacterium]|nr:endolytic transglycosylase MltG [Lachnospiraceae bacterium]